MTEYPVPEDEKDRLAVLSSLKIVDSPAEEEFDALVAAAKIALDADAAMLSLIENERQWFKAKAGIDECGTPRELSFCTHAIMHADTIMIIPDATKDPRFAESPLVSGPPFIRFYAGAPIVVRGQPIGTLCVLSGKPRTDGLDARHSQLLGQLAVAASVAIEARTVREQARRLEDERLLMAARMNSALNAADMSIWSWNVRDDVLQNFGQHSDVDTVKTGRTAAFLAAIHPDDREDARASVSQVASDGGGYRFEYRYERDPRRWFTAIGEVVKHDAKGRPLLVSGVEFETTNQRRQAERAEAQAQELRHRVNNLIGLTDALAGRTAREVDSLADFLPLYRSRLQALARTQRLLLKSEDGANLEELIEAVIAPFRRQDGSVISVTVPDAIITSSIGQTLTLVIHELTTNALKYGALRWPYGKINVGGRIDDGCLHLAWREAANRQDSDAPEEDYAQIVSSGSGQSIMERMVGAEGGAISFAFDTSGLIAEIKLPL